jgi:predicted O-linked N-acetylglucosamine transferase (SPINDLY family)
MTPNFQDCADLYRRGQFGAAEGRVRALLAAEPRHADALQLAGLLAMHGGRAAEALEFWRRSVGVNPRQPAVYLNMGSAELSLQRPQAALAHCDAALALRPDYADALLVRGHALRQLARLEEALASVCRVLSLRPDDAAARSVRGTLLMELLRPLDAIEDFGWVCRSSPHDPLASFNLGLACEMARDFEAAVTAFDATVALAPGFAPGHYHRGIALRALGRHAESLDSHSRANAAQGGTYVDALCGAGDALRELGRVPEALSYYERARAIDPRHLDALSNCGRALLALRRAEEAVRCYERLFDVAPEVAYRNHYALGHLLHARLSCCDWRQYADTRARIDAAVLAGERVTLPSMCLVTSGSSAVQLACARGFVADNWQTLATSISPPRTAGAGKIRLAYVSADFRQHPVASLLVNLIETHDRARFEVIGVTLRPPDGTPLGERILSAFDRTIDISGLTDGAAIELLRGLSLDIAVDLNGYTDGFRAGLFARRIAPVQVSFLGYTGTLGAPYIDYLLADDTVIPPGDDAGFTEKIVRLPGCYMPMDSRRAPVRAPMSRQEAGLPASGFVYCCFNNHYKLTPRMFDVWMRMLAAVEDSVLWLPAAEEPVTGNLRAEAQLRGVAPERLLFAPRLADPEAHLARVAAADLFLDTLPFNAHTTAADALWAGLPVLTCRGTTFAGRVCASLVSAAGLPGMVTPHLAEYESRGISLARSPGELATLRRQLSAACEGAALYDHQAYRRGIETAYATMMDTARQ